MEHIIIKSAHLPKSKIRHGGSPTTAINDIIASLTALAPAGIEVTRQISTSKHTHFNAETKQWTQTDLISRVSELVIIKANLAAHSLYAAWTAARVDGFAKGGSEIDTAFSGSVTNAEDSYASFGAGRTILKFTINYQPSDQAQRGEGYAERVHAEMAPLAALAEARALWEHAQVGISNSKFRRAGYGRHFEPLNCATVVKNTLNELDSMISRLSYRADWATKRATELTPDLLAAEAAKAERARIRAERRAAALAKANAGDEKYWPSMDFGSTELKIKSSLLNTSDIEAIAEIIAKAKARKAAKEAAQKAA